MDGYDMGNGGWGLMIVAWVVLLAVIVWAVVRIAPGVGVSRSSPDERPLDILDRRLARGEIDADGYDRLRAKLMGGARETTKAGSPGG